jgi:hypothetical protein
MFINIYFTHFINKGFNIDYRFENDEKDFFNLRQITIQFSSKTIDKALIKNLL